jgi:hypothetical protein
MQLCIKFCLQFLQFGDNNLVTHFTSTSVDSTRLKGYVLFMSKIYTKLSMCGYI